MNGHTPKCRCFPCSTGRKLLADNANRWAALMSSMDFRSKGPNLAWATDLRKCAK